MFWLALTTMVAAAPMQIDHSFRALDSAGTAVNGEHLVTTRLYDAMEDGSLLWTSATTVQFANGYGHVPLSGGTPELSTEVFSHPEVWLEVQVGTGPPLSPRTRLSSVPYALAAEHAATADSAATAAIAGRVVLDTGDGTGACTDGMLGLDASTQSFRVCVDSMWVVVSTEPAPALGTTANPAASCQAILDADPLAVDATYVIDPDGVGTGAPYPVYCDMLGTEAWAMVYQMCQDSPNDIYSIDHNLPVSPASDPSLASIPYATVAAMNPSRVRFASDMTPGPGYIFDWSTATSSINQMEVLLQGLTRGTNTCVPMGEPLPGSSGFTCSMSWQHNNNGSEGHDIPTLGCPCSVWYSGGMQWGQIDGRGNYNGVSHIASRSWDHSPMSTQGCIHAFVQ